MPLNSFQEEFLHALRDGYEQEMAEASDTARCKFLVHNLLKPQHVPARVEAKVPLLVKASSAKPHGYGIFIKEPVKAGELVFKVKKPMLNIEVKRLPTERKAKLADRNLCQISQACAVLLCSMKISKMEYEEVRDIFYMTFQNQRNLTVPLIKGHSYLPLGDAVHIAGVTFEPFTSTIAHSCNPNCWIIFEGHELCLRALRDITAFEELTVTYVPEFWDQLGQQSILRNRFNIECQYMESEGLGWDVPATLFLHQSATLQYLFSGNTSECLKRSMKARGKISHRTGLTRH
ncbi:putative SET and MYND domain-containing protein 3 [Glarea lozoyensis 74030]|uniref:Putative SET and MYND domain-containing protein 3 n=1 Tax=Glarea lozoyensis (strain ATCC 74030 / MF5533) TaxID=1104152 RepID=H0ELT0_GLAL7|nr:putative SET and MYND domain-containing protein 3 [Glarea lozoyensis 74030]